MIFGSPDLPHNKRQHLLGKYSIVVTIIFVKDFPLNLNSAKFETTDNESTNFALDQQALLNFGGNNNGGAI